MSRNYDTIKRDIIALFSLSKTKKDGPNIDVDSCMRKLAGFDTPGIPSMLAIEEDIIQLVKSNTTDDAIVLAVQDYLRKLRNASILNPNKFVYFLKEMSPLCKDSSYIGQMKPFISVTRSVDNIRTSTPLLRSQTNFNRLPNSDLSSVNTSNQPLKTTHQTEHNFIKSMSFHNASGTNTNNSTTMLSKVNKASHNYRVSNELTEHAIIGDLLFVILGCNGQYFSWNSNLVRLKLADDVTISNNMHCLISKLAKLGMAYSKIRAYVDRCFNNQSAGVVCQGFCAAINEHLASYNNLVSVLHSQYNAWTAELEATGYQDDGRNRLTLQRIVLWLHSPGETLLFIMTIVDNVTNKKGGELASSIYQYLLNGSSTNQKLMRHLLLSAADSIFHFIDQWMHDGVLDESHQEFFVAVNTHYDFNNTWTEKYALRPNMIPSFITLNDAEKILLAGKSINFLREICEEKVMFRNLREFARFKQVTAESMINQEIDRSFEKMIATVYVETSKNLLQVMFKKYQLMNHLKALRNYLLQGQGDCILRLIELIGPELSKPGSDLHRHNMMGQLDEAMKTTNAQYDSREILDRVDIKFMAVSSNELGWDIFTLDYNIADLRPLMAVITKDSFKCYVRTFISLFRSRRVHYILNSLFKKQNSSNRLFSTLSRDVYGLIHFSLTITQKMMHFVNQIQYYINFEVIESCWKKFTESVNKATDLNQVMDYHQSFLKQITQRCLLEPKSRDLLSNLRTIYDLIIDFESIINDLFAAFQAELHSRRTYNDQVLLLRGKGKWGVNDAGETKERHRIMQFTQVELRNFHFKLKAHYNQFQAQVIKFMSSLLNENDNPTLRCLYTHLDFNDCYKDQIREFRRTK